MPTRFAGKASKEAMYPALESAVRELASDNIMCAVMLTGVLFLQVRPVQYYSLYILLMAGRTILLETGDHQRKDKGRRRKSTSCTSTHHNRTSSPHIHAVQRTDGTRGNGIEGIVRGRWTAGQMIKSFLDDIYRNEYMGYILWVV
jgi:hypothetical protein